MKILLHVGAAKTGSTSIQHYLGRSRDRLAARGVMVQSIAGTPPDHMALGRALVLADPDPTERQVLERVLAEAAAAAPEWLVLSSEAIWIHPQGAALLRQRLAALSDDITLVAYLREPVALYRAHLQQQVRFGPWVACPLEWEPRHRETITAWQAAFGDRLLLAPFQPSSLYRSHLGADFLHRGGVPLTEADIDEDIRKNLSESAEVSSILQDYHRANYPRGYRVLRRDASDLRRRLNRLAATLEIGNAAVLAETVPTTILARARDELLWMADTVGIRFDTVPYDRLGQMQPDTALSGVTRFDQVCAVDPAVKTTLEMALIREFLLDLAPEDTVRTTSPERPQSVAPPDGAGPIQRFLRAAKRVIVNPPVAKKNHQGI